MKKTILSLSVFCTSFISINLQANESSLKNQYDNLIYTYTVTINNKPYKFILQTGYSETIIDKSLANQLGGIIKEKDYPARLKNIIGDTSDKNSSIFIKAPEMKIGNNNIYLDILQVHDLSAYYKTFGFHIDGVLGMNAINQYIWEFDNANKKNYIHPYSAIQIEKKYPVCMFYDSVNGTSPVIYINKHTEYIPFVLAFGTDFSVINNVYINILNLKKSDTGDTNLNRLQDNDVSWYMDDFIFANQQVKRDRFFPGENNSLGTLFLNRFDRILLNPITQTFCFNHFNTESTPQLYRELTILANNGNIEIAENNETILSESGLKNGDIIVSVNNIKYPTEQIILVRKAIAYSKNLDLEIKRDGKIIPVTIKSNS